MNADRVSSPTPSQSTATNPSAQPTTVEQWSAAILSAQNRTVEAISETGRVLLAVKAATKRGDWSFSTLSVRSSSHYVGMSSRTGEEFMAIVVRRRLHMVETREP